MLNNNSFENSSSGTSSKKIGLTLAVVVVIVVILIGLFLVLRPKTTSKDKTVIGTPTATPTVKLRITPTDSEELVKPTSQSVVPTTKPAVTGADVVVDAVTIPSTWSRVNADSLSFDIYRPKGWYSWRYSTDVVSVSPNELPKAGQDETASGFHYSKSSKNKTTLISEIKAANTSVVESTLTTPIGAWTRLQWTDAASAAHDVYISEISGKTFKVTINYSKDGENFVKYISKLSPTPTVTPTV
ncbi:MAG: hypothetical protein WCJ58_04105 [bacterium]